MEIGILLILAISIAYAKQPAVRTALSPLIKLSLTPMRLIAVIVGLALKIILLPFQLLILVGKRFLKKPAASHNPQIS